MTDADHYSNPERFTERRGAKRYRAAINRLGLCCACIHRDRENTAWGKSICQYGQTRIYPQCQTDGRASKFEPDGEEVHRIMEGMQHAA